MQALVYGNGGQESERAKMVLEACGQEVKEFLLGADFSDRQFRAEFGSELRIPSDCHRTQPQRNSKRNSQVHVR